MEQQTNPKLKVERSMDLDTKINSFFKACRKVGIRCEKDWTCCASCGHDDLEHVANYIFYHQQTGDDLKQGASNVYLQHRLTPKVKEKMLELAKSHGVVWDGSDDKALILTAGVETNAQC